MTAQTASQYFLANIAPFKASLEPTADALREAWRRSIEAERAALAQQRLALLAIHIPADAKFQVSWYGGNVVVKFDGVVIHIEVPKEFEEPAELVYAERRRRHFCGRHVTVDAFAKFVRLKTKGATDQEYEPEVLAEYWLEWADYVCTLNGARC